MGISGISDVWAAKIAATEASEEGSVVEETAVAVEDDFEKERAAATAKVPTSSTPKEEVRSYLIYEHGIDPDDLLNMTKDEMLSLVTDLAK